MLILEEPVIFLDIETTGLSVRDSKIIQFGAVKFDFKTAIPKERSSPVDSLNFLINPCILIDPQATAVHGITNEMVMDEPVFDNYALKIHSFLSGCHLSGFNVRTFDIPILEYEFARVNMPFPPYISVIDVMQLVHKFNPRTLVASVRQYIPDYEYKSHDAYSDALSTAELFHAMTVKHKEISETIVQINTHYADVSGYVAYNELKQPVFNFGKYKNELLSSHSDYCKWLVESESFPLNTVNFIKQFLKES
jgi:DNA polymerase-3 subunit epsilon